MDLCSLPVTGTDGTLWPAVIAVAALMAIATGVLLRARAQQRRRIATGVVALAVVGALALGSLVVAPEARADGGRACVAGSEPAQTGPTIGADAPSSPAPTAPTAPPSEQPTPPPTGEPAVAVTPQAPTAAAQCGLAPAIAIPTQEGVDYVERQDGPILTVTATAADGFVIAAGAQTTWSFDTTPTVRAPFPLQLPLETVAFASFLLLPDPNATYGLVDRDLVPTLLAAAEPGVLDVAFSASAATMPVTFAVVEDGVLRGAATVDAPVAFTLAYDAERGVLVLTETVAGATAAAVEAARAEVQAANPDALLVRSFDGSPDLGLAIDVTFAPGPGCAAETYSVAIDAVVPD